MLELKTAGTKIQQQRVIDAGRYEVIHSLRFVTFECDFECLKLDQQLGAIIQPDDKIGLKLADQFATIKHVDGHLGLKRNTRRR